MYAIDTEERTVMHLLPKQRSPVSLTTDVASKTQEIFTTFKELPKHDS